MNICPTCNGTGSLPGDDEFAAQFAQEVRKQYGLMGSKLRNTVTPFDKHGCIPMDRSHAGNWVDDLEELKSNRSEFEVVARASAYALGRISDDQIVKALDLCARTAGRGGDGLTKAKVLDAFEMLGHEEVAPSENDERYAIVGWKQWADLLGIQEFANADYIGKDDLPWKGTQAKRWLGTLWMPYSGLTKDGANIRHCYWYRRSAIGHAIGDEVLTDISWHGDRSAHFVKTSMYQGAHIILPGRVVRMPCLEF